MKDFLKLLAFDSFLWLLIIGGLYLQLPYLGNLALFTFPLLGLLSLLGGLGLHNWIRQPEAQWSETTTLSVAKLRARPKYFRRYTEVSTTAEILAIAALGHFVIAGMYLLGAVVFLSGRNQLINKE